MTVLDARVHQHTARERRTRHYVMCSPDHFCVEYSINPWMNADVPVDKLLARRQWDDLRTTFEQLGHRVDVIDPMPGQPDMVFAANGGLVVGDRAYGARFRHPERSAEADTFNAWLRAQGLAVTDPIHINEGEGDFLALGSMVLAGTGFRTNIAAHIEAAAALDRPVVSLELIDPRFYHLDTALAVLDDGNGATASDVAYFPAAFSPHSRRALRDLFPEAIVVDEADALVLGLNAVSDGRHVVLPTQAEHFAEQLEHRGYLPVPIDLSEFLKSGGSVKCCTMERHR